MSDHHNSPTIGIYLTVFMALLFFTGLTIWVAFLDLGPFNNIVALSIACFKAFIVILYFMHVRYSSKLVWLVAGAGFLFLVFLFAFTMADLVTRGWLGEPGSMYVQ